MCQLCNRTSALSLQATLLSTLIKSGLPVEQAEGIVPLVLHDVASSEVSHPEWAAKILNLDTEEEPAATTEEDDLGVEIMPGVHMKAVKVGPNGVEDVTNQETELPPGLGAIIGMLASAAAVARASRKK